MARYANIINGVVTNVELWNDKPSFWQSNSGSDMVLLPDDSRVSVDYTYDGTNFTENVPVVVPVPVPTIATKGQLIRALWETRRTPPESLDVIVMGIINGMFAGGLIDADTRVSYTLLWQLSNDVDMSKPAAAFLVGQVAQQLTLTQNEVDDLFILAVTL